LKPASKYSLVCLRWPGRSVAVTDSSSARRSQFRLYLQYEGICHGCTKR
jgi:hypothetical protein